MKKLPDSELEIMIAIWNLGGTAPRTQIEILGRHYIPGRSPQGNN